MIPGGHIHTTHSVNTINKRANNPEVHQKVSLESKKYLCVVTVLQIKRRSQVRNPTRSAT